MSDPQDPARAAAAAELAALEHGLAQDPRDADRWRAALHLLLGGRASDDQVGAAHALAGERPFRVAVVTAYYDEDLAVLERCHRSVQAQTYPCHHVLVADGNPRAEPDDWDATHLRIAGPHRDFGDTPRCRGGQAAAALGFDAIAYLDADNTYRPRHVEALVARCARSGAAIGHSGRTLHLPDGRLTPVLMQEDFADHVDTSCLLVTRPAFDLLDAWLRYPRRLSAIGDRMVVRIARARGHAFAPSGALTLRYAARFALCYRACGLTPPADARPPLDGGAVRDWLLALDAAGRAELDRAAGFDVRQFALTCLARMGFSVPGG